MPAAKSFFLFSKVQKWGAGSKVEYLKFEPVPTKDTGYPGGSLTRYITMLAQILFSIDRKIPEVCCSLEQVPFRKCSFFCPFEELLNLNFCWNLLVYIVSQDHSERVLEKWYLPKVSCFKNISEWDVCGSLLQCNWILHDTLNYDCFILKVWLWRETVQSFVEMVLSFSFHILLLLPLEYSAGWEGVNPNVSADQSSKDWVTVANSYKKENAEKDVLCSY